MEPVRLDKTEAAFAAARLRPAAADQRLVRERVAAAGAPGCARTGTPPGPDVAEGLDDQAPHFSAIYGEIVGLDAST